MGRSGERYKFLWQGGKDGNGGVGVLVAEKWVDQVVKVNRVDERILVVQLLVGRRLVNVISTYAPQVGRSDDEKDVYWDALIETVSRLSAGEAVILGGDLNGHVGSAADGYGGVHGDMGFGARNAEGERILEFGDAMEMVVCNTFFKKEERHLATYESGGHRSQIDFLMVRKGDQRLVKNVKVIVGEECVSQHRLVIGDLTLGSSRSAKKKHVPRLRVWKLSEENVKSEFQKKVAHLAEEADEKNGIDGRWDLMRKIWLKATEEVCGWTKGAPRHKETWWWNDEVKTAVDEKRRCFRRWKRTMAEEDRLE